MWKRFPVQRKDARISLEEYLKQIKKRFIYIHASYPEKQRLEKDDHSEAVPSSPPPRVHRWTYIIPRYGRTLEHTQPLNTYLIKYGRPADGDTGGVYGEYQYGPP